MQFPHLSDTQFPDLQTVNVYKFQNTFDYTRWNEKTKLKLCNVLWNSEYADVVKFDTDSERDSWFDSLDAYAVELRSSARVAPDGYVKLPIPYDVLARYNYLYIDMPIATSANDPLDYETESGVRRWYFFLNDIRYMSPSATQAFVIPDIWTNFQNQIEIPYMLLERGHAPVAYSDTDSYLLNPLENNKYLLAPDVNYDNAGITKSSSYVPFGNGTKFVCIASTCAPNQVSTLGTVTTDSSYSPTGTITYSDVDARYGYQLEVHGLTMGNGRDYSNANTPATVGATNDGRIANNLTVYAIAASEVYGPSSTFMTDLIQKCPQFLTTVKACFVVDERCITRSIATYTIAGHVFRTCIGNDQTLLDKVFTKADFGYPQELQRFAKLYTAPYARLEITDNDGVTYEVNIEETSHVSVKSIVSVAFPYINERVYIDGIGGTGSRSYVWKDLRGNSATLYMPNADWFKYCFDWEIPTFALYMDGETAFMLESFNRNVKQAMNQSLVNYHNSMRSANTAYENACDQADVAYTNTEAAADTARTNAYNSADTGKTNSDNTAVMLKENADLSADTANDNVYDSADAMYNNTVRNNNLRTANVNIANATLVANEDLEMMYEANVSGRNVAQQRVSMQYTNSMIYYTTDQNIIKSTAGAQNSSLGSVVGGALSGASGGTMIGLGAGPVGAGAGALIGGIFGAATGGISATVTMATNGTTTNTDQAITDKQIDVNYNQFLFNEDIMLGGANFPTGLIADRLNERTDVCQNNVNSASDQTTNTNNTAEANASVDRATMKGNSLRTRNTAKTNATNSKDTAMLNATNTRNTSRTNANNTYVTTEENADRTRDNVKDNSGYTRQVAELNAKEILENGKYAAMASILDARNAAPVECCSYNGNPTADYMRTRGVQIKVKTQNDSAIRQTGDTFARFGYTLNQIWDVATTGLKLMQHFTYWKAAEIWVDDSSASNNSVNTFVRDMFMRGVTVWNKPTEIGRVNVYTN